MRYVSIGPSDVYHRIISLTGLLRHAGRIHNLASKVYSWYEQYLVNFYGNTEIMYYGTLLGVLVKLFTVRF